MIDITYLPKDIFNICLSYLFPNEAAVVIYSTGKWKLFQINKVCEIAAINGWLDLLIWARENHSQAEWKSNVCNYAALRGHLKILKWVKNNGLQTELDRVTCAYAFLNGHSEILKWTKLNGCICDGIYHKENIKYITLEQKRQ